MDNLDDKTYQALTASSPMALGVLYRYGVEIVRYSKLSGKQKHSVPESLAASLTHDDRLIRLGDVVDMYDPFSGPDYRRIYEEFAYGHFEQDKALLKFHRDYGPLKLHHTYGGKLRAEKVNINKAVFGGKKVQYHPVSDFLHEQKRFYELLWLYNNRNRPNMIKLKYPDLSGPDLSDVWHIGQHIAESVNVQIEQLANTLMAVDKYFVPMVEYRNLLDVIYLQFRSVLLKRKKLIPCKNVEDCERWFVPAHGKSEFHSVKCRQRYNDRKRER